MHTTDKRVAQKRLDAWRTELEYEKAGIIAPKAQREASSRPLADHLTDYLGMLQGRKLDDKHLRTTRERLQRLLRECHWSRLADMKAESFCRWRDDARTDGRPICGRTKNQYLSHLRGFLKWLIGIEAIAADPLSCVPNVYTRRESREDKRAFADSELVRLLDVDSPHRLVYFVAACSGLRWDEARRLTWADLEFNGEPVFNLPASLTKNARPGRVPMFGDVAEALRAVRPTAWRPVDRVFRRLPRFCRRFSADLDAAGIRRLDAHDDKACFHALRKTFCTMLHRMAYDPSRIMTLMRVSDRKLIDGRYLDREHLVGERDESAPQWWPLPRSLRRSPSSVTEGQIAASTDTAAAPVPAAGICEIPQEGRDLSRVDAACPADEKKLGR